MAYQAPSSRRLLDLLTADNTGTARGRLTFEVRKAQKNATTPDDYPPMIADFLVKLADAMANGYSLAGG